MVLALFLISLNISYLDWRYHRIPNQLLLVSLALLSVVATSTNAHINLLGSFAVFSCALVCYKFGLGAGDVKLITLLSLFFLPSEYLGLLELISAFSILSLISIINARLRGGSLTDCIPLAPAICGAFIWCAR